MIGWAIVFVVATWAALVTGLAPVSAQGLLLAALVTGLGLALLALLGRRLLRSAPRARRAAGMLAVAAALLVAGLEVGLRVAGAALPPSPSWLPASSTVEAQIEAFRFAPGSVRFGFPCNSLGYCDDEPPGPGAAAPWIACLGDSFVACAVPQPVQFTTLARRESGVAIHAFGVQAAGPREYLWMLERDVLPRRPTAVLLSLFVGNDVSDSLRGDQSLLQQVFHPRNARLLFVPERLARAEAAGPPAGPPRHGRIEGGTIIVQSAKGEVRGSLEQLRASLPVLTPWLFDRDLEIPPYSPDEHLEIELGRAMQACDPADESWAWFFAYLDQFLDAAGRTPVAVLLIPDEFQVDDALWAQVRTAAGRQPLDRDLPQRRIAEFLRGRGVPCLDVLPPLRAAAARGESAYLVRNTHLNLRGNEIVGQALAEFVPGLLRKP